MGLLDGVSAGLTAATKAATGAAEGREKGSALLRAIQMQQIQMAKSEAEMGSIRANTDFTKHRNAAPVLGEDGYNTAKAGEAGAIADAQVPAHVRTAVQSAQGTEPIRTAGAIATAAGTEPIHTRGAIATAAGVAPIHTQQAIDTAAGTEPIHTRGAIATAAGVAPIHTQQAVATAAGTAPIEVKKAKDIADAVQPGKIALERAKLDNQPLRQDEAYTAMHLPRIAQSIGVIQQATAPGAWQKIASRGLMGNYTLTPQGQQYNAAVHRAALSLAVTLEGPRGATPQRVDMVEKTYFPQPGDDDTTVAAKIQQLKEAVRSGVTKAGRGYDRMNPQDRAAIERFTGDSPATDAPASHPIASKYGITPSVP